MNTPKKYICQVNFNLGGTLLYDSEEELWKLQHRIEDSLLGVFFKVGTSAPPLVMLLQPFVRFARCWRAAVSRQDLRTPFFSSEAFSKASSFSSAATLRVRASVFCSADCYSIIFLLCRLVAVSVGGEPAGGVATFDRIADFSERQIQAGARRRKGWYSMVCGTGRMSLPWHRQCRGCDHRLGWRREGGDSIDTPGGKQEMSVVSEPGLYSLVLRSRKAEAKRSNAELCMWSSRPYARPVAAVPRCFRTLGIRRRPRGRGRIMRSSGFSKNGSASCWSRGWRRPGPRCFCWIHRGRQDQHPRGGNGKVH